MEIYEGGIMTVVVSTITGIVTWLTTRRKQRNDFIKDLQASIDLLADKNRELMQEILTVREQNTALIKQVSKLEADLAIVKRENEQLTNEIQILNEQLKGVKTITRTKQ